ncbi:MAG TPA: GNAT family N-acetyltransferase [Candidatus Dormibacteraeota bacterium]|nr:GNAT family N-acetyltransferase [Candidatus Dormibacteraeota bacterium]
MRQRVEPSITEVSDPRALHELAELFATIWGVPGELPLDPSTLRALSHSGNYVAGAYSDDQLVGGLIGWLGGHPTHDLHLHSHILGVLPETAARGVGFALKQHQRSWCMARGVKSIQWTFDPLVRRNAYFNLVKLGAGAVEYLIDFYGTMDDGINAGDSSDRVLVSWELGAVRATAAAAGHPLAPRPGPGALLVPVPDDIVAIRRNDPALARRWRQEVRDALGGAMSRGYRITGFSRGFEYVLARG